MRVEKRAGMNIIYPHENKILVRIGEEDGQRYAALILSPGDSPENYTEIDILTPEVPIDPEPDETPIEIIPDPDGKISFEDAKKLIDTITVMQDRLVSLQENNDLLTECILEMSEVVYNV